MYFANFRTEPTEMVWTKVSQSWGLRVPQKVQTKLVQFLLSGICILVYSCTGCGTSKMYLCLEDNRSSFSRVSLKSETKHNSINSRSFLFAKDMIFRKQKFDIKELEDE